MQPTTLENFLKVPQIILKNKENCWRARLRTESKFEYTYLNLGMLIVLEIRQDSN